ncbi:MAG: SOS response-associated peptidase [Planctomycetota bacterium]
MCGRFSADFTHEDVELLEKFLITDVLCEFGPHYNVAPTQGVAVVVPGSRQLERFHWGLIPHWSKERSIGSKMINARAETIGSKPSFRDSFRRRRCLIPTTGFYEWDANRTPHYIQLRDERIFAFAGLHDRWTSPEGEVVHSCTVITCPPNSFMADLHDRMPVILDPSDYDDWLLGDPDEPKNLQIAQSLLVPTSSKKMTARKVSKLVNSPRNDRVEVTLPPAGPQLEQGSLF